LKINEKQKVKKGNERDKKLDMNTRTIAMTMTTMLTFHNKKLGNVTTKNLNKK
jgi:hypothetical protein